MLTQEAAALLKKSVPTQSGEIVAAQAKAAEAIILDDVVDQLTESKLKDDELIYLKADEISEPIYPNTDQPELTE